MRKYLKSFQAYCDQEGRAKCRGYVEEDHGLEDKRIPIDGTYTPRRVDQGIHLDTRKGKGRPELDEVENVISVVDSEPFLSHIVHHQAHHVPWTHHMQALTRIAELAVGRQSMFE